jgi:hypothetical protein
MEVRDAVFAEKHVDDDPEESRDFRDADNVRPGRTSLIDFATIAGGWHASASIQRPAGAIGSS